jgi:UDP-N-acetylmuramate: L-alanyl-gamma-D-glutamyl-meso-diaminopimelate ligase
MSEFAAEESAARIARLPPAVHHVHLLGVGGTAMAAVAGMFAERGFRVTGSDGPVYEPTASLLRRMHVQVSPFGAANLFPPPDLVIVGNVITRTNPEAEALLQSAIPYLSMPEALRHFFLRGKRVLMVTGTHGKTTSTAMMAHVLDAAGRDPSLLVGGLARDFGSNYRLGKGPDFVIEGDEYDTAFFDKGPKFLHYGAQGAIITAVEFDHADIYRDLEHVKASFRALARQMDPGGVLVVSADSPDALEASAGGAARRLTFGLRDGEFRAEGIRIGAEGAHFTITHRGRALSGEIFQRIDGRMNIANALGVYVLLREFGIPSAEIERGLASFRGVARRQEVLGEAGGITVIDDFAHHPTAIRATLEAVAERFAGRRILAAFEPRSNTSRRNVFQDGFSTAFERASRVYLAPVYFKDNDPIPAGQRLSVLALASRIRERGAEAAACTSNDEVLSAILHDARPGDVALFMSNGAFERLPHRFLEELRAREARKSGRVSSRASSRPR